MKEVRRRVKGSSDLWRGGYCLWGRLQDLLGLIVTDKRTRSREARTLMGGKKEGRYRLEDGRDNCPSHRDKCWIESTTELEFVEYQYRIDRPTLWRSPGGLTGMEGIGQFYCNQG